MKKLLIALIIILLLSGTVFYFGWIQLQLPENTYAVIFTKTGGWDDHVTVPGTFVWRWEKLIPTNLSMHKFTLEPHTARLTSKGSLPSADVYRQALDPQPDFSFSLTFAIDFAVNIDALPNLVSEGLLTEESYAAWHDDTAELLAAKTAEFIRTQSTRPGFANQLTDMGEGFTNALRSHLSSALPSVELKALTIRELKVPDFELYNVAKDLFIDLAKKRKESYESALEEIAWTDARTTQHFGVIERYGQLITDYPALLELFALKEGELGTILDEIDSIAPLPEASE